MQVQKQKRKQKMNQKEMLDELGHADDLENAVSNAADAKALQELRNEVAQKRREDAVNIGHNVLVGLPDGTTVPVQEFQQELNAGHDAAGPHNGGAHSAN